MTATDSRQNLDAINFFVAAAQTGFGPFIAIVLTEHGWTPTDIGLALSVGTIAANRVGRRTRLQLIVNSSCRSCGSGLGNLNIRDAELASRTPPCTFALSL